MKIAIEKYSVIKLLVCICFGLMMFSSACLWNANNLRTYIIICLGIIVLGIVTWFLYQIPIRSIVNNPYNVWLMCFYGLMELYGTLFLRTGGFNWDLILVGGAIQYVLTALLVMLKDIDDVIEVFCKSCKWTLVIVCAYMYSQGTIGLSNITFGTRLGDELSGNVNTVATCFGIMLIPTFYLFLTQKKRISTGIIVVVSSVCMLLTGSKKGVLVLAIMLLMYLWIKKTPLKYVVILVVGILGVYALFNVPVLYNTVGFRVVDAFATMGIGTAVTRSQSTSIRNEFIHLGLKSFLNVPIFGGGMNYFQYINRARYYSHNNYVELLNTFGLLGFLLFYLPFIKRMNGCLRVLRERRINNYCEESNIRCVLMFCVMYTITKFILDYAMVSFTGLCIFNTEFLICAEINRRVMNRDE